ncbi:MAG: SoxR reducing system RseC family protein [Bacteroidales bacterium]|nr:SoxR reducing system RseC family protein [Bacteroidales bacterium]
MAEKISHEGIVTQVGQGSVTVKIQSTSACGSCHAKSLCQMSEKTDKEIRIKTARSADYRPGETVNVFLSPGMGLKAVLYAYVFSLVAAAAGIFLTALFTKSEPLLGLGALVALALYFLALKVSSRKIDRRFSFGIEKKTEA